MQNAKNTFEEAIDQQPVVNMGERQEALRKLYLEDPGKARIKDGARTSSFHVPASSALYTEVTPHNAGAPYEVGVHTAVGGESDFPVPGDILSAAIASCLDSCIRIIANRLGVKLKSLEVVVEAEVDVHGTLRIDDNVPVGFQNIEINVNLETEHVVQEALLDALLAAAEHSCVIIQTLRTAPTISVSRHRQEPALVDQALATVV